jgi:hypothetical protein
VAVLALAGVAALAEGLKPTKEFRGRVSNELALAAKDGYVAGPRAWARLWKDWKIEGKLPKIDWKNEVVLIGTSNGSRLSLNARLEMGDLRLSVFGTDDLRPDSGFHIIVVPSKGVKTINGKKPVFEKDDAEP